MFQSTCDDCRIIAPLACDLIEEGADIGPETARRDELAAAKEKIYREQGCETIVVVSAGMAPGGIRTKKFPLQERTFAEMQRIHLIGLGVPEERIVSIARKNLWGTLAELDRAVRIYKHRALHYGTRYVKLEVVTSASHRYRVRFILTHWFGVGADMALVPASKTVTMIEFVKFPIQATLLLWRKWRLKRAGKWPSATHT